MIVFLTVYLGLIGGRHPFELRADPAVKSMRLLLDGREVAAMAQPPWKAEVDFGDALQPHEIAAVGFNAEGHEIARASQVINLPKPRAEVQMIVHHDAMGMPTAVDVEPRHAMFFEPSRITLRLDGAPLRLDRHRHGAVPAVDMKRPHVLSAEAVFSDGAIARREIVFGGEFGENVPTELTPIAIVPTRAGPPPASECFALRVSSVEKPPADLLVVRDPDPSETRRALRPPLLFRGDLRHAARVEAAIDLVSPVPDRVEGEDHPTAYFFPRVPSRNPEDGLYAFSTTAHLPAGHAEGPRRWADAVAAAAVEAIAEGRRRAVILLLGSAPDASRHSAAAVRGYLDSVGVPLFVWSTKGSIATPWGEATDVSSLEKLERATEAVKRVLDEQRIAWIYADPIAALHAHLRDGCGWRSPGSGEIRPR